MSVIYICFTLSHFWISFVHRLPEILPNVDEIHLIENDTLLINCTGPNPVLIYPPNSSDIPTSVKTFSQHNFESVVTIELFSNKIVNGDSGWYGCVDANSLENFKVANNAAITPYNFDYIDVKWIYVFVESSTHHLVGSWDLFESFFVKTGKDILIPCRLSSPYFKINLTKDSQEINLNDRINYDPKRGFVIKNTGIVDSGYYECTSEGTDQKQSYYVVMNNDL